MVTIYRLNILFAALSTFVCWQQNVEKFEYVAFSYVAAYSPIMDIVLKHCVDESKFITPRNI